MKNRKNLALALGLAAALGSAMALPAAAAEDGTITCAITTDITTLDVARTTDNYMVPMNCYDRLFETRMVDGSAEVVNSLCTDYTVSEDGLTYDFTLEEGVAFSNGNPLTASDVAFTFERLLKMGMENMDIPLEIKGGQELADKEADSLEGFTVKDDTHFSITLNAPNSGFPAELSAAPMSIMDAETMAEAKGDGSDPAEVVGTGPYIITEWVPNDHYTLEVNENYRGEAPSVKKVIMKVVPDPATQSLMFQNGELDILDLNFLDSSLVNSTYKTEYADQIVSTPRVGMFFMALNENNEYLKDVNVRKAVWMSIDVKSIIDSIYFGDATQQNGLIPTGVWGHDDSLEGLAYDPEGAMALLEEAGYKSGDISFEISVDNGANSNVILVNQIISEMLNEVGINATLKNYDHGAWLDARVSGEMDSFVARWGMDYNDPANIMVPFFGSESNTHQRSLNYPDKEVIQRVHDASSIVDDEERKAEFQALEKKIITEDVALVPLYEDMHLYCLGERVESFVPHWAGFSDFYITDVTLK